MPLWHPFRHFLIEEVITMLLLALACAAAGLAVTLSSSTVLVAAQLSPLAVCLLIAALGLLLLAARHKAMGDHRSPAA